MCEYNQKHHFPQHHHTTSFTFTDFWRDCSHPSQQNAFGLVEAIVEEGEGEADNAAGEEELNLFYDDLEEEWLEEEEEH